MKKLIVLFVALVILLPVVGLADPADVSSMTDEELKEMISACSAELMKRNTNEPEGILLFEYDGYFVYQTDEAYIKGDYILVPVLLMNNRETETSVGIREAVLNGWDINVSIMGASLNEKSKKRDEIRISLKDTGVSSLEDVESFIFRWTATEGVRYVFKEEERTEHRFW